MRLARAADVSRDGRIASLGIVTVGVVSVAEDCVAWIRRSSASTIATARAGADATGDSFTRPNPDSRATAAVDGPMHHGGGAKRDAALLRREKCEQAADGGSAGEDDRVERTGRDPFREALT